MFYFVCLLENKEKPLPGRIIFFFVVQNMFDSCRRPEVCGRRGGPRTVVNTNTNPHIILYRVSSF